MLTVYTYANCDTCRRATKWLTSQGIAFEERPIRETPPSVTELKAMLAAQDGELRKLFNTSGKDYRELGLGDKLASFSTVEALNLLTKNGNLAKRPFAIAKSVGLVGFNEAAWAVALVRK